MPGFGWRAVAVLAVLAAPLAAAPQRKGPMAEVDVAVTSNVHVAPEHTRMYVAQLVSYSRMCLGGLFARSVKAAPAQPQDGAAYYRLSVAHAGSVVTAAAPQVGPAVHSSAPPVHYLLTRQKGRFQFDLARWTGAAYERIDRWTSTFSTVHHTVLPAGLGRADLAKWRRTATMSAYPEAVMDGILGHLLPVRVLRTFGPPGGTHHVVVSLENASLWPLKSAKVGVGWSEPKSRRGPRYHAELLYAGLLMPGEKATLRGSGTTRHVSYGYELAMPMQITVVPTFDPTRGPVWIRRQVEAMKVAASRTAAARIIERSLGRMTPVEMTAAAQALIPLLAHDAPQSDADVPQDVRGLLQQVGAPAVKPLADALANANPGIRLGAACVLQRIKVSDAAVQGRLRAALKDACRPVRAAAAKALEANGVKAAPEPDAKQPQEAK